MAQNLTDPADVDPTWDHFNANSKFVIFLIAGPTVRVSLTISRDRVAQQESKTKTKRAVVFYCNCVEFWCQHFDVGWVRLWYQFRLLGGGFWMASVWVPRGPPGGVKRDNSHME